MNFLNDIRINYVPPSISNDDPQGRAISADLQLDSSTEEDINIAQALVDHLNEIMNWQDRIKSLDYLSKLTEKEANNPTYYATSPDMINAIKSIGGPSDGTVDLNLIKTAIALVLESHNKVALNTLSGGAANA